MKNLTAAVAWTLLLCVLCCACSCEKQEHRDYLKYQEFPFSMEAEITCGSFSCAAEVCLQTGQNMELRFRQPKTLKGVTLTCSEDGFSIGNGTVLTRLPEGVRQYGAAQLIRFFNLKDIWISSVELSRESGIEMNVLRFAVPQTDGQPAGSITVKLDGESGVPCCFEGELGGQSYEIRVLSFAGHAE